MRGPFPFYRQLDHSDCGPTCLRMVAAYFGRPYPARFLREKCSLTRAGVSLHELVNAAEQIGLRTLTVRAQFHTLRKSLPRPCIAHWRQKHFVVVYGVRRGKVLVADPALGLTRLSEEEFLEGWLPPGQTEGALLLLEPTPRFFLSKEGKEPARPGPRILFSYLASYKPAFLQLLLGMLLGSLLQLAFPFLTQALVDVGIGNRNLSFVYMVLLAQLALFVSRASLDVLRSWILLHIGARVNVAMISDFLAKLMRLPLSYFESRKIGDVLQRIGDHQRVQAFLTSTSLSALFSALNVLAFGTVLAIYSLRVFLLFLVGTAAVAGWLLCFSRKRRELDYQRFDSLAANQSALIQLISGLQEIKLHGAEDQKRSEWHELQGRVFRLNLRSLAVNQYQHGGSLVVNEFKNILLTVITATEVVNGNMTLGMMMAVSYIVGAMSSPVDQLLGLFQAAQDAKLSLERIGEVYEQPEEAASAGSEAALPPPNAPIRLRNVTFRYDRQQPQAVLQGLNLEIESGSVTAIVGSSGTGKTTLLKVLLKIYEPTAGEIRVGQFRLDRLDPRLWRQRCGVVMQDGYVFSDTVAGNIALGEQRPDRDRLAEAARLAQIAEFIESLPEGYATRIGADGHGLSQGQRQRILIARAVYKDPAYVFFDEATSALDGNTERAILDNLADFFRGRTVLIIAHRLSTAQKADRIVVLDGGAIIEEGTHDELARSRRAYYKLVRNQLELGSS